MGGQTALGYYDADAKLVSYWFMSSMDLREISEHLDHPLHIIKAIAKSMLAGNCLLDEFKSKKFHEENDLIWAVMFLPESIVCYNPDTVVILKKRVHE